MAEEEVILEAEGLTKEFAGFVAVKNVDLRVRRHTIHALIGPNGAGKTTCFNLLTHFLTPTKGQIRFNGRNITGSSPAAIARMGLARSFQISAVFPHLSVRENVRVALQRLRVMRGKNAVHLGERERRAVGRARVGGAADMQVGLAQARGQHTQHDLAGRCSGNWKQG